MDQKNNTCKTITNSKDDNNKHVLTHIDLNRGPILMNNFSPAVVMKKIDQIHHCGYLPVVEDEDEASQIGLSQKRENQVEANKYPLIKTINNEELINHIQKCLEMSLENKITQKNAFALQLIDGMGVFLQKKQDFSMIACTLDAGAKIYSYRVDALHQQVIKLADEVILHQNLKKNGDSDVEDDCAETVRKKRRINKRNIIASKESLTRKPRGKDPKSRFIKLDALPGSIISRARREPTNLSYSLENDLPFWTNWKEYNPVEAEGTVTLPNVKILRETRKSLTLTEYHTEENQSVLEQNCKDGFEEENFIGNEIKEEPSQELVISPDHDNHFESSVDEPEVTSSCTNEVEVISNAIKRLNEEAEVNGGINKNTSRVEAMKIIFKEASEYHYLDMKNASYWAGPEFWKRPILGTFNKQNDSKRKVIIKEPKEISYDCDTDSINRKWDGQFKRSSKLSKKAVANWNHKRLTLPQDLKIDVKLFFDLFHMLNCNNKPPIKTLKTEKVKENSFEFVDLPENQDNDNIHFEDHECSGFSNSQDPLNASFYKGVPGGSRTSDHMESLNSAFYDVGLLNQPHLTEDAQGKVIQVHISPSLRNTSMYGESMLVPIPKKIKFEPIKCAVKPIQVDMRHLKQTMLDVIKQEIDVDQSSFSGSSEKFIPETKFSSVLQKLPAKLEKKTAEDLSTAMGFMALLTLTNENNLWLEGTSNSDIIIRLDQQMNSTSDDVP